MDIDIAIGGMDQRKAHMFMRDVASKYGWEKATCLHTPIVSSLKASGARMESFDHKMSKSDPNGALLLHDTHEQIRKKMKKAYISPDDPLSPVYELAEHILLPEFGEIVVTPNPRFGEPSTWTDLEAFRNAVMDGTLHPLDAKFGVADGLSKGLESLANHFDANPETLDRVTALMNR
ncbi:MAG: tyrosine--tRNA ligase, partial [Candidatus Thermoplasmatota archaeon]|nr:tyrosine--tRNA ligase [Candidatus Thermoplasmatota archaeon]